MLVRRQIGGSLEYGHPHLYEKSAPGTILADTTMASMTGTLAQIGLLSHYAARVANASRGGRRMGGAIDR